MSFLYDFLPRCQTRVEQALDRCMPSPGTEPRRLHEAMRYVTLNGGKRLRAALVYATGAVFGAPLELLDAPACAAELVHAYSLVHDDLPAMDNDDLRRGKPTCHRAFDEATALLAGDALQSLAFELLARDPHLVVDAQRRLEMIGELARAVGSLGMAGGQAIDLAAVGQTLNLAQIEDMHARKTGALIRAAVALGALAAPQTPAAALVELDRYGRCIGLAFQITDDILDVAGATETLGKPQGSDQRLQKPTYPALLGLERARALAREQHDAALASLRGLGDNSQLLSEIAAYILDRTH
ncbi:MAG: (2E,6E)-farnesyl diphosphate synthase [Acidiferrobacterales bacterium]